MSIESRLSAVERRAGEKAAESKSDAWKKAPGWLLPDSEIRRFISIAQKFTRDATGSLVDHGTATPDEIELAELIWSKVDIHCDRAAANKRIRQLETEVNQYNEIKRTAIPPTLTDAQREQIERFWAAIPTLKLDECSRPRTAGMLPQQEQDLRFFQQMCSVLPVGEL